MPPISLKFYTDVHIPKQVALQLRKRGVDVVRRQDVAMDDARDLEHLAFATQEQRALVSIDQDFRAQFWEARAAGRQHAGIFRVSTYLQGPDAIGRIVTELFAYF